MKKDYLAQAVSTFLPWTVLHYDNHEKKKGTKKTTLILFSFDSLNTYELYICSNITTTLIQISRLFLF